MELTHTLQLKEVSCKSSDFSRRKDNVSSKCCKINFVSGGVFKSKVAGKTAARCYLTSCTLNTKKRFLFETNTKKIVIAKKKKLA